MIETLIKSITLPQFLALPEMKPANEYINGQIIAGHDYNTPGVYNAIRATFLYPDIEIYLDSSWCIKKTDSLKLINQ